MYPWQLDYFIHSNNDDYTMTDLKEIIINNIIHYLLLDFDGDNTMENSY